MYILYISSIDHFSINHRKLLGLFKTLLRHPTCPAVGAKRLVEMMAINIFEIANMTSEGIRKFALYYKNSSTPNPIVCAVSRYG